MVERRWQRLIQLEYSGAEKLLNQYMGLGVKRTKNFPRKAKQGMVIGY